MEQGARSVVAPAVSSRVRDASNRSAAAAILASRALPNRRRHPLSIFFLTLALLFGAAGPGFAEHRARLSADLADHLSVGSQSIDVIVHGQRVQIDSIAVRYNLVVVRRLRSGAVLRVNAGQLDALAKDSDIDHLSGDLPIRSSAAVTNAAIGADELWAGVHDLPPISGRGVTVAVIDSGIDTRHPALRDRVVATVDFTGGNGLDGFGHGTHVAGIIAGQPGQLPDTRDVQGVAGGAQLVNLRVLGDDGSGLVSSVVEAIDWAVEHRSEYNIGVINLSIGTPVLQPYRDDPLCEAAERAVAAGIVVVASAGNFGRTTDGRAVFGGVTSPGNDPVVLTVGALDTHDTAVRSDDTVATFSSRGPTRYDMVIKPDVVAPGVHVVSAEAGGSYLSRTYPERHVSGDPGAGYQQLSGTSMSAAVVSGVVALLLEARDQLTPAQVKNVVQLTSSFLPTAGLLGGGAGSVDALAAVTELNQLLQNYGSANLNSLRSRSRTSTTSWSGFGQNRFAPLLAGSLQEALWGDSMNLLDLQSIIWSSAFALDGQSLFLHFASIIWSS
jgi:serine protease AprX